MSDNFFDSYDPTPKPEDTESLGFKSEDIEAKPAEPDAFAAKYEEVIKPEPDPIKEEQPVYTAPSSYSNGYGQTYQSTPSYSQPVQPARPQYTAPGAQADADGYYHRSYVTQPQSAAPRHTAPQPVPGKQKKERARVSAGAVAIILIVCVIISGFAGFGGAMLANSLNGNSIDSASTDAMIVHKVEASNTTETSPDLVDKTTAEITAEVADSVVEITTEVMQTSNFYGQYIAQGAGSGVIIDTEGYILTNNHVIEDASSIEVTLRSGESYPATLIGTDATVDIALLKIDADNLTASVFGDSDTLKVGDKSVIIGNPLGTLGGSVTEGIISALDRAITIDGKTMHLMQTDAAINPGNSGGGMYNGQGELCGIVVAKSSGSTGEATIDNIGFVIPINNVLNILSDLKESGYVRGRADTGMDFIDLSNSMYSMYYYGNQNTGVYITSVEQGSNAYSAGFRAGDRVVAIDGKEISSTSDITEIISTKSAGDTVEFELDRQGSTGKLTLTLEEEKPDSVSSNSKQQQQQEQDGSQFFRGFGF